MLVHVILKKGMLFHDNSPKSVTKQKDGYSAGITGLSGTPVSSTKRTLGVIFSPNQGWNRLDPSFLNRLYINYFGVRIPYQHQAEWISDRFLIDPNQLSMENIKFENKIIKHISWEKYNESLNNEMIKQ